MNLLVTGAWSEAQAYIRQLENGGNTVVFAQHEKDNLPCQYDWVEGVICNGLFLYHDIKKFVNLKYIQLTSAGFDRVDVDYVSAKGITIRNARGVYSIPMAEFALASVLSIYKKQGFFCNNQKQRKWEKNRGLLELFNKTVCVVGCGNVGGETAKRFGALGCNVVGVDAANSLQNNCFNKIYSVDSLDNVIKTADVVVLTLPLNKSTHHLFDKKRLNLLKDGCVFVNMARGAVVNTCDLAEALSDNRFYAVLDVFEEEPLCPESPLWDMENVIITPHNSFVGDNNGKRLTEVIFANIKEFVNA